QRPAPLSAMSRPADISKRALDVIGAAVALVTLLPLIGVVAAAAWWSMGPPVLFRHERAGLRGRRFTLLKFRTMRPGAPGEPDEARLTRLGSVLRSLSLDELPQFWNALRGDMSLVGPRPLLPEYLPRYPPAQARRPEGRPGLTGLVQVSGRNALSWEEKFALDVGYVVHASLRLD